MNKALKYLPIVAGIVLGLLFIMSAVMVLFNLAEMPPLPEDTPMASFMEALVPTGYMTFVKVCELVGGVLVIVPFTRNIGLLFLGPIIINILAFHIFITGGAGLLDPMLIVIVLCALYLLWDGRKGFAGLLIKSAN